MKAQVLSEESAFYESLIEQLNTLISDELSNIVTCEKRIEQCSHDLKSDARNKQFNHEKIKQAQTKIKELESIKEDPYIGRFKSIQNDDGDMKELDHYIGHESFEVNGEYLIINWKDEYGKAYRNQRLEKFKLSNHPCTAKLRRKIDITNGSVTDYQDVFTIENNGNRKRVVDPFLQSILNKRKKSKKLTSIIGTIQEHQNDIIELPLNQSFIVQGCAGSGKSMVLMHRLSYVTYNHTNIKPKDVIVITPSEIFDHQFDSLSKKLKIDGINTSTIEEHYFKEVSVFIKEPENLRYLSKFSSISELKDSYVEYIFSNKMFNDFNSSLDIWTNANYHFLSSSLCREFIENSKIHVDFDKLSLVGKIDTLRSAARVVEENYKTFNKNLTELSRRINAFEEREFKNHDELVQTLSDILGKTMYSYSEDEVLSLARPLSVVLEKIAGVEFAIIEFNEHKEEQLEPIIEQIMLLRSSKRQLKATDIYERGKIDKEIKWLNQRASDIVYTLNIRKKSLIAKLELEVKNNLLDCSYLDSEHTITYFYSHIDNAVAYSNKVSVLISSVDECRKKIEKLSMDREDLINSKVSEEVREFAELVNKSPELTEDYFFDSFIMRFYREKAIKYNQRISGSERCLLYVTLQGLLRISDARSSGRRYMYIDEGQNITCNEYSLLKVLNKNTVFNIFGDVMQNTRVAQGISNWTDVCKKLNCRVYELKENYRNSIQITSHCNKVFNRNDIAIGIYDREVERFSDIIDAFNYVQPRKSNEDRMAIILKHSVFPKNVWRKLTSNEKINVIRSKKSSVSRDKINVLDVEFAKGLEFDIVISIDYGMNRNEKYVSYTRALNYLSIVS